MSSHLTQCNNDLGGKLSLGTFSLAVYLLGVEMGGSAHFTLTHLTFASLDISALVLVKVEEGLNLFYFSSPLVNFLLCRKPAGALYDSACPGATNQEQ